MATPQKTNLSPLAEQWREKSKRCKHIADECGDDSVFAQSVRYWMCADELKQFAAEHLTEQAEPSTEDEDQAWGIMDHLPELKYGGDYVNHILAKILSDRTNAERRRISELLVGKETK